MKVRKQNPILLCYMSAVALSIAGCSQNTTKTKPTVASTSSTGAGQVAQPLQTSHSEARLFHYSKKGLREVDVADTIRTKRVQYEYGNLWERLFDNYSLPDVQNGAVERELSWFVNHPAYLQRAQQRAEPFLYNIVQQVERQGVPGELALLPVVESAFQAQAVSSAKAAGIWQFIPTTGRNYGLKQNHAYDGRRDVYASTKAAMKYLKKLNHQFHGDWLLAIAAYNCGEGAVERAMRRNAAQGLPTDFWSLDLPQETRAYVPRLLAVSKLFSGADRYGLDLRHIPNEAKFKTVKVSHQLDLAVAADAADMSLEAFRAVNPGFKQTFVDPDGSVRLFVPAHKSKTFKKELARLASVQSDLLRREFESRASGAIPTDADPGDAYASVPAARTSPSDPVRTPAVENYRTSLIQTAINANPKPTDAGEPQARHSYGQGSLPTSMENPFEPTAFQDNASDEGTASEASAPAVHRSSARSPHHGSTHSRHVEHASADSHASSRSSNTHARSSDATASRNTKSSAHQSARATNSASRSSVSARGDNDGKKTSRLAANSSGSPKSAKGRSERSSSLASPQKSTNSKASDSRKSSEKIVTARADTSRLRTRR